MSQSSPVNWLSWLIFISPFCFRCDENAKVGVKMIYASFKDTIKKSFTGLSLEFQANDGGDLDYKTLSEEVEKRAWIADGSEHDTQAIQLFLMVFVCLPYTVEMTKNINNCLRFSNRYL